MKHNFAQRVIVKTVPRTDGGGSTSQNKAILQAEVNKNKFVLDKSVFVKTAEEKERLKIAKAQYKLNNK
jgi:hypothetical protein